MEDITLGWALVIIMTITPVVGCFVMKSKQQKQLNADASMYSYFGIICIGFMLVLTQMASIVSLVIDQDETVHQANAWSGIMICFEIILGKYIHHQ